MEQRFIYFGVMSIDEQRPDVAGAPNRRWRWLPPCYGFRYRGSRHESAAALFSRRLRFYEDYIHHSSIGLVSLRL